MDHTTGLTGDEITELCVQAHATNEAATDSEKVKWLPVLGLFKSVVITLTYLRGNRVQAEIGESFGVFQSTVSRAIKALTPLLGKVLRTYVPTADELDGNTQYIVDGTLLPCWSWASHPELYSGKHKTTSMNAQLFRALDGNLAWISDSIEGSRHDTYCLRNRGFF